MAVFHAFRALRPTPEKAADVAALPYDVVNREEAKSIGDENPLSFLHIDRPEMDLEPETDLYDDRVYEKAKENLDNMEEKGILVQDQKACYYIYELVRKGKTQTGIVGCSSIDDYVNGVVKKHENTREDKELDRIRHVDTVNAQTGPIFLAYRQNETLKAIVAEEKAKPVLKKLPGWKSDIRGIKKYEDLPENCRKYIEFVEEQIGYPITMVSNGPGREDIIYRNK